MVTMVRDVAIDERDRAEEIRSDGHWHPIQRHGHSRLDLPHLRPILVPHADGRLRLLPHRGLQPVHRRPPPGPQPDLGPDPA